MGLTVKDFGAEKRLLVLMVGLVRSGKSTLADKIKAARPDTVILCPDDMRYGVHGQAFIPEAENTVWASVYPAAVALLRRHTTVIIDATNTTRELRGKWTHLARFHKGLEGLNVRVVALCVDTPMDVCLNRCDSINHGLKRAIEKQHRFFEPIDPPSEWIAVIDMDLNTGKLLGL